jgi:cell division protein FtsN
MERRDGGAVFGNEKGSSQQMLLLVLLLLMAVLGYVYFFTGLIRPQEQPKPPAQTAVKKPLPPRPAEPGAQPAVPPKPAETKPALVPAKPEEKKPASPAPKPAPASVPAPAKPSPAPAPAKAAPASAKPAAPPAKPAPASPAAKAVPAPAAKPAPSVAKAEPKTPAPGKPAAAAVAGKEAPAATKGNYTLLIGSYAVPQALEAEKARVKKAGLAPSVKKGVMKATQMNRLFLGEYSDKAQADEQLRKLKQATPDAFILPYGEKYQVYAGSYYLDTRAAQEQDRLLARGFKLLMRKAEVPVRLTRLTAGKFSSREDASKEAVRLKKFGIPAVVVGGK